MTDFSLSSTLRLHRLPRSQAIATPPLNDPSAVIMLRIGERISVGVKSSSEVHHGTIRFVGTLSRKEGVWAGVEWDDATRGKHDGSFEGIKYFDCLNAPPSASFVKASKIRRGVSLADAFFDRYQRHANDLKDMTIETAGHRHMAVTLRGEEEINKKISDLHCLESATMHSANISYPV